MPIRRVHDAWMETYNVRTLRLDFRDEPIDFKPGQFIVVSDRFEGNGKLIRRAYSIASSPWQREFVDVTIKREIPGLMSRRLTEIPVGHEVKVTGPGGKYLYEPSRGKRILLLGAGSGITPLHSIASYVLEGKLEGAEVFMFFSVKSTRDIIYKTRFEQLAKDYPNFHYHLTITRDARRVGRASWPDFVAMGSPECGDVSDCVAYICGPGPMVNSMENVCAELDMPPERVNTEKW